MISGLLSPALNAQMIVGADVAAEATEYGEYDFAPASDPLEGLNRRVFWFNDRVFTYVLKPVSTVYVKVVPKPARTGLVNFYDNVRYPVRLVGSLLQGRIKRAGAETARFGVNTVAGLGGFLKISDSIPELAAVPNEDIGQAFGSWGIPHGPYVVIPLFGGSSLRDLLGRAGDTVVAPTGWDMINLGNRSWIEALDWQWETAITVTDNLSGLPEGIARYDELKASALDPYIAIRDGMRSYREREQAR
jgi:phospholipid-binding lipoprotein MlaA